MSGLTVYCCGPIPRLRRLLETVDGIARLADWRELETLPSVGRCLFAIVTDDLGPVPETTGDRVAPQLRRAAKAPGADLSRRSLGGRAAGALRAGAGLHAPAI